MDHCSFTAFHNALRNPNMLLRTLHNIEYDPSTLTSTKYFAKCYATINSERVILYAPITHDAIAIARAASAALKASNGDVGNIEIYPEEILCEGAQLYYASLIIERIAEGIALREALYTHSVGQLKRGLERLRERLQRYDISHNHLSPDNIIVDSHHQWHPIHSYYATKGYGDDRNTLRYIDILITECAIPDAMILSDTLSTYTTTKDDGIKRYDLIERRRRIVTPRGVGFEDESGRVVIEDRYLRATDFMEDRSTVVTPENRAGVIDRRGTYIIEPRYDAVEFDVDNGLFTAQCGDKTELFDYLGQRVKV